MCIYKFQACAVNVAQQIKVSHTCLLPPWADPEGGQGVLTPPGKEQVAIGFLRHAGNDLPREAIGYFGSNCFSREVRTTLCVSR